ncbi:MAG: hypothetical protein D6798_10220 [Deltaproteobacteria bacterium]|nr:MAG: hypothetical protein D6798_10220 [Deltaproteobacteria bacterium]
MISRSTWIKLAAGCASVLAVAAACGVLLRDPLVQWGTLFLGRFGMQGLFVGVWITDSSIVPMTSEPLIMLAISAGARPFEVLFLASLASACAGPTGWVAGRLLAGHTPLGPWLARRHPDVTGFLTRYGARFVAVAALLPFPFAVSTWLAGASAVRFRHLLLASLLRIPKTVFYGLLIVGGWAATG